MMDRAEAIAILDEWVAMGKSDGDHCDFTFGAKISDVEEALDMAIAALQEREQRQWKSSALPPKDKGLYLAYISSPYGGYEKITCYTPCYDGFEDHLRGRAVWYDHDSEWGDYEVSGITHWRYLPESPKESAAYE